MPPQPAPGGSLRCMCACGGGEQPLQRPLWSGASSARVHGSTIPAGSGRSRRWPGVAARAARTNAGSSLVPRAVVPPPVLYTNVPPLPSSCRRVVAPPSRAVMPPPRVAVPPPLLRAVCHPERGEGSARSVFCPSMPSKGSVPMILPAGPQIPAGQPGATASPSTSPRACASATAASSAALASRACCARSQVNRM